MTSDKESLVNDHRPIQKMILATTLGLVHIKQTFFDYPELSKISGEPTLGLMVLNNILRICSINSHHIGLYIYIYMYIYTYIYMNPITLSIRNIYYFKRNLQMYVYIYIYIYNYIYINIYI